MDNTSNIDNIQVDNSQEIETAWSPAATATPPIKPRKPRQLTRKQQAYIKYLVDNPKASATQAVKNTYNVGTDLSARQQAHDNLTNPNILSELSKYSATAEMTLLEVMSKSKEEMYKDKPRSVDWANTARQTADSLLDRLHGKATTRVEQTTTAVTLNIDLTGVTETEK